MNLLFMPQSRESIKTMTVDNIMLPWVGSVFLTLGCIYLCKIIFKSRLKEAANKSQTPLAYRIVCD